MSARVLAAAAALVPGLVAAPAALGDGVMPYAAQGGYGVLAPAAGHLGPTRYVAVGTTTTSSTALEAIDARDGSVQNYIDLPGNWGVPFVTWSAGGAGLSTDGKTLVLGDVATSYPRPTSRFLVLGVPSLRARETIELKGDFAFDALSPDASRLYLIQHVDETNMARYVVRAYDLGARRLLPGRIADRTQRSWVMQGSPMARAESGDGRWVYTLYSNPGGYPFVHALDTVRGVAHCVGLPWHGGQNGFYNLRLSLRDGGRTLAVHWLSGRRWLAVDTADWRVSPDRPGSGVWPFAALAAAVGAATLVGLAVLRRRRRRQELEQELADLVRLAEREVVV